MSADILQFIPRSNPNSDRAFWIGQTETEQRAAILNSDMHIPLDSAPAEYNYQADEKDPA